MTSFLLASREPHAWCSSLPDFKYWGFSSPSYAMPDGDFVHSYGFPCCLDADNPQILFLQPQISLLISDPNSQLTTSILDNPQIPHTQHDSCFSIYASLWSPFFGEWSSLSSPCYASRFSIILILRLYRFLEPLLRHVYCHFLSTTDVS